ncbi:hypothetical protein SEVIR_4G187626v4 [Setaria viridis]
MPMCPFLQTGMQAMSHQWHPQELHVSFTSSRFFLAKKKEIDLILFFKKKSLQACKCWMQKNGPVEFWKSKPRRSEQGTTEALTRPVRLKVSRDDATRGGLPPPRLLPPQQPPSESIAPQQRPHSDFLGASFSDFQGGCSVLALLRSQVVVFFLLPLAPPHASFSRIHAALIRIFGDFSYFGCRFELPSFLGPAHNRRGYLPGSSSIG